MNLLKMNGFERIYQVDCFTKEFQDAVNEIWLGKSPYKRYQKKLIEDLAVLDDYGENAIKLPQFEALSNTKCRLYSIRHPKTKKNVRILYVISKGSIILLTAFLEKNISDYTNGISRSEKRYSDLISNCR